MTARIGALTVGVFLYLSQTAAAATCDASLIGNGVCDCGCSDSDCPQGSFTICQSNQCPAGNVPWEAAPSACMSSACGDGWNDSASGEVCDDGNALPAGGCSADCKAVNPGYVCGQFASGCRLASADAGAPDAGVRDAGVRDAGVADAGLADAGVRDAGVADAGQPMRDSGTPSGTDGGVDTTPMPKGGCTAIPAPPLLIGMLALVLARRRLRPGA